MVQTRPTPPSRGPRRSPEPAAARTLPAGLGRFVALAALGLVALVSAPLSAQQLPEGVGTNPIVRAVTFEGVTAVSVKELAAALETQAPSCRNHFFKPFCLVFSGGFFKDRQRLEVAELPRDALRAQVFYWLRGYRGAAATSEILPVDGGVEVRFTIAEGPPTVLRSVEVVQDTALLSDGVIELARLPAEGEPADMIRIRLGAAALLDDLQDRGYADATVDDTVLVDPAPRADGEESARLVVRVEPGRPITVGAVEVLGNVDVTDQTVERLVDLPPGRLYRRDELEDAQRRLFRSGLFRRSIVQGEWRDTIAAPLPGAEEAAPTLTDSARAAAARLAAELPDTARPVIVSVIEAPAHELELGGGVSTVDFVQAQVTHIRYNFLGGGRRLDLSATVGNLFAPQLYDRSIFSSAAPAGVEGMPGGEFLDPTWSLAAGFTQPWFLSSRNELGLSLLAQRRTVPGVVVDHTVGARASVTRRVTAGVDATLSYNLERTRVEAGEIYFCVNFGVCQTATIASLRRPLRLAPLELTLQASRLEQPLNPVSGYMARIDLEHAAELTASQYAYTRISGEVVRHFTLGPGVVASRVRAGWVRAGAGDTDVLHPRKRFFAGGQRSVRGYAENQLGPRILTVPAAALIEGPEGGQDDEGGAGENGGDEPMGCTEATVRDGSCDPSALADDAFVPRPLGGDAVVEGTVEYRFPILGLGAALFVDAGWVGARELEVPAGGRAAITPGFGLRYSTPMGLIRVDLGIRPTLVEELPVVTRLPGEDDLVTLALLRRYDPVGASGGFFSQILQRMVLHLSIGEAF
jgi:outer membrane protein insertion porin family/translocation and assembly module TamA